MAIIDHNVIAQQLAAGDAGNAAEKGAALENVVSQTFCLLDGVGLIRKNIIDDAGSLEIDLMLYNQREHFGLPFLPDHLIIECKNWQAPVNAATLTVFTGKLHKFRVDFGILVAANGITGNPHDKTAAHAHLRSVFDRDGMKIVVITRYEIEALRSTDDLTALMRLKYGDCIMGVDQF